MDAENSQSDGIAANHSRMQVLIEGTAWVSKQPHREPREVAKVGDSMRLEGMNETRDCTGTEASHNAFFDDGFFNEARVLLRQEMLSVIDQLVDRLVNIRQRCVGLRFFESRQDIGLPALGQLFEGADIKVAVVKKPLQLRLLATFNRSS